MLVLQEAPRRFRWRQRCADLARRFRLVYAVGGLPALGNLILVDVRVAVDQPGACGYPLTPGQHMRGAAVARCAVAGRRFVVAGTHLSTDPLERPAQARQLRQELAGEAEPLVLAADVNDEPGSETWKVLADGLTTRRAEPAAPTFPAVGSAPAYRRDPGRPTPGGGRLPGGGHAGGPARQRPLAGRRRPALVAGRPRSGRWVEHSAGGGLDNRAADGKDSPVTDSRVRDALVDRGRARHLALAA